MDHVDETSKVIRLFGLNKVQEPIGHAVGSAFTNKLSQFAMMIESIEPCTYSIGRIGKISFLLTFE